MKKSLTVEYFKSFGVEPYYFGLGFIQLKVNERERYHFYHPELPGIVDDEEIHDHTYSFTSHILKGTLVHDTFEFQRCKDDNGTYEMTEVSCKPDAPADPKVVATGYVEPLGKYRLAAGAQYWFPKRRFHRVKVFGPTITHLYREPKDDYPNAFVIRKVGAPAVCAFSKKLTQDEVWQWIERVLND